MYGAIGSLLSRVNGWIDGHIEPAAWDDEMPGRPRGH
jgi:hypothetical protein